LTEALNNPETTKRNESLFNENIKNGGS